MSEDEQKIPIGVNLNIGYTKRGKGHGGEYSPFLGREDAVDKNVFLVYDEPPSCTSCGSILLLRTVRVDHSPYLHCDFMMQCPTHGWTWTFGVPMSKTHASALHIYDTNIADSAKKFAELGDRECPWKHGKMLPTKVFGDWIPFDDKVEFQWKCPFCHVTHHEMHDRDYPHAGESGLTAEEMEALKERFRKMGYIE